MMCSQRRPRAGARAAVRSSIGARCCARCRAIQAQVFSPSASRTRSPNRRRVAAEVVGAVVAHVLWHPSVAARAFGTFGRDGSVATHIRRYMMVLADLAREGEASRRSTISKSCAAEGWYSGWQRSTPAFALVRSNRCASSAVTSSTLSAPANARGCRCCG